MEIQSDDFAEKSIRASHLAFSSVCFTYFSHTHKQTDAHAMSVQKHLAHIEDIYLYKQRDCIYSRLVRSFAQLIVPGFPQHYLLSMIDRCFKVKQPSAIAFFFYKYKNNVYDVMLRPLTIPTECYSPFTNSSRHIRQVTIEYLVGLMLLPAEILNRLGQLLHSLLLGSPYSGIVQRNFFHCFSEKNRYSFRLYTKMGVWINSKSKMKNN